MRDLGLPIDQTQLLPDLVLAELGREPILLIFVEVVATDGPVTAERKLQFLELTDAAGYDPDQIVFLSAFRKRNASPLKRRLDSLAVDSAVWCMAEPDLLIWLGEKTGNPFPPAETRFQLHAARGRPDRGLELLNGLDAHYDGKDLKK